MVSSRRCIEGGTTTSISACDKDSGDPPIPALAGLSSIFGDEPADEEMAMSSLEPLGACSCKGMLAAEAADRELSEIERGLRAGPVLETTARAEAADVGLRTRKSYRFRVGIVPVPSDFCRTASLLEDGACPLLSLLSMLLVPILPDRAVTGDRALRCVSRGAGPVVSVAAVFVAVNLDAPPVPAAAAVAARVRVEAIVFCATIFRLTWTKSENADAEMRESLLVAR